MPVCLVGAWSLAGWCCGIAVDAEAAAAGAGDVVADGVVGKDREPLPVAQVRRPPCMLAVLLLTVLCIRVTVAFPVAAA